jgi:hypothetical protein
MKNTYFDIRNYFDTVAPRETSLVSNRSRCGYEGMRVGRDIQTYVCYTFSPSPPSSLCHPKDLVYFRVA